MRADGPGDALERGDGAPGDAAYGRDARHPGRAVDPDRAAAALALGAAPVLDRATAELFAQRVEERDPVRDRDALGIQGEDDVGVGDPAGPGALDAQRTGRRRAIS
jgi:hypothetical protein